MTTLITQNSSGAASSASATIVLPAWTAVDDDLILITAWCNTGTASPLTKATSSNGSANPINEAIFPQTATGLTFRSFWYYARAGTGDSGSTVTIPWGVSTQWSVQCRVYQSSFFGAVQFKNGSTAAASCTFTAFTPGYSTSDGAIVVEFAGNVPASGVTTTFTNPTNYVNTQHVQSTKASSVNAASWSGEIVTAGTLTAGTPHTPASVTTSNTAIYQTIAYIILPTSLGVPYVRGWQDVSNNTGTATAASISCTVPSGMDFTKDTIIAFLTTSWAESGVAPTDANITPPTGFVSSGKTPVTRDMGGSSAYLYTQGFYKHPTGNDTGTYTFVAAATVNSGAFNSGILTACVVRNLGTTGNPFGAVHSTDTASAASLTLSFTPAANGTLVLGTVCRDDTQAITAAGFFTNGYVEAQGAGFSDAMISWFNQGTAAATGTQTFTISGGSDSARVMMFEFVAAPIVTAYTLQPVRRRPVPPPVRRRPREQPRTAAVVVTTQALPPQPTRRGSTARLGRRRPQSPQPLPVQVAAPVVVYPPQPLARRRQWGPVSRRRRVDVLGSAPPPVQQPARRRFAVPRRRPLVDPGRAPNTAGTTPPVFVQQPPRRRVTALALPRRRSSAPPPTQALGLPPQPARRRVTGLVMPRRRADTLPVTVPGSGAPQPTRRRLTWPTNRRPRRDPGPFVAAVVVAAPSFVQQPQRRRVVPTILRRRTPDQGVIPQSTPTVVTQALPPQPTRRRLTPTVLRRRAADRGVVPATTPVVVPPPAQQPQRRRPVLARRRATSIQLPPTAAAAVPTQTQRRATRLVPRRRTTTAPTITSTATPTTAPPQPTTRRRPTLLPRRRRVADQPTPPTVVVPPPKIVQQPIRRRLFRWPRRRLPAPPILIGQAPVPPSGPILPVTPGDSGFVLPGITDTGHTSGTVGSNASGSSLGAVTSTASPTKPVTGA